MAVPIKLTPINRIVMMKAMHHWLIVAVVTGVTVCSMSLSNVQAAVVVLRGSPDWYAASLPSHGGGVQNFENHITNFYNNRTDWEATAITRSITNELSGTDLAGANLLIVAVMARAFTTAERSVLSSFVNGGRHIMFVGENGNFVGSNNLIVAEIALLGGTMSTPADYSTAMVHGNDNFHPTTANGQIFSHLLTQNVDSFAYGSAGVVTGGDTLFTRPSGNEFPYSAPFAAAQQIGNGLVSFLADTNVVPNTSSGAIGSEEYDNDVFFYNAAAIGAVPEPTSLLLTGLGFLALLRRRRA